MPERFELGTLPYELLAGTTAAIDFLAGLVDGSGHAAENGSLARWRLRRSIRRDSASALRDRSARSARSGLPWRPTRRSGRRPCCSTCPVPAAPDVARHLATRGVSAPAGSFYAVEASRHLGLGDGGAVRVGLAAYSAEEDVRRLLGAVDDIVG